MEAQNKKSKKKKPFVKKIPPKKLEKAPKEEGFFKEPS